MTLTIICKKAEKDGQKWTNYIALHKNKWYDVKFVKDCAPPQMYKITDYVVRAFIKLDANCKFDMKSGQRNTLFIETYNTLTADELQTATAAEKAKIDEYNAKKEREKMDFLSPSIVDELPF